MGGWVETSGLKVDRSEESLDFREMRRKLWKKENAAGIVQCRGAIEVKRETDRQEDEWDGLVFKFSP